MTRHVMFSGLSMIWRHWKDQLKEFSMNILIIVGKQLKEVLEVFRAN